MFSHHGISIGPENEYLPFEGDELHIVLLHCHEISMDVQVFDECARQMHPNMFEEDLTKYEDHVFSTWLYEHIWLTIFLIFTNISVY